MQGVNPWRSNNVQTLLIIIIIVIALQILSLSQNNSLSWSDNKVWKKMLRLRRNRKSNLSSWDMENTNFFFDFHMITSENCLVHFSPKYISSLKTHISKSIAIYFDFSCENFPLQQYFFWNTIMKRVAETSTALTLLFEAHGAKRSFCTALYCSSFNLEPSQFLWTDVKK